MASTPKPRPKRQRGRPSKYSAQVAAAICRRLAEGESLRSICGAAGMPDRSTVVDWLARHAEFSRQYACAREVGLDHFAELTLEEATNVEPERVQSARLSWDARRWHLSKMLPKRYGERIAQEHSGPDGSPVQLQPVAPPMLPREVGAAVRALIAKAEAQLGMPAGNGSDASRLKAIMASGEPPPPELYAALWRGEKPG